MKAAKKRTTLRAGQKPMISEQHRTTIMLISIVMVFLICQTPQATTNIVWAYFKLTNSIDDRRKKVMQIVGNICNLLVIINASINFALYSSLSERHVNLQS